LSRRSLGEGGINQFESIMQNKPNLPAPQMNVSSFITKDYENERLRRTGKTNPIQSQYKAKTNPIPERPKMNLNFYSTKDYENTPPSGSNKTNPIKPNFIRHSLGEGGFKIDDFLGIFHLATAVFYLKF
jgi:hypothetical protein